MVERKTKAMLNGKQFDAVDVPIEESTERWSEFKLEDGTTIRMKLNVLAIMRIDGQYDQAGTPMYQTNVAPIMVVVDVPDRLKKKKGV
jgi:hypothetical protein